MKFCVNEATTMETDIVTDIKAYATAGFKGMEVWLEKVDKIAGKHPVKEIASLLKDNGVAATGGCAAFGLMLGEGEEKKKALSELKRKLDICATLGAPVIIIPSDSGSITPENFERSVKNLSEAGEVAAKYDIQLALEFIKGSPLLGCLATTNDMVRKIDRENVGVLFDTFHFYVGISKIADIRNMPEGKLFFVHINDCIDIPRETMQDCHRTYIGNGIFPVKEMVDEINATGYDGWFSFEIFDQAEWKEDPFKVAEKAYKSLQTLL
jgi:2-keto-myo-inositol isomerase